MSPLDGILTTPENLHRGEWVPEVAASVYERALGVEGVEGIRRWPQPGMADDALYVTVWRLNGGLISLIWTTTITEVNQWRFDQAVVYPEFLSEGHRILVDPDEVLATIEEFFA